MEGLLEVEGVEGLLKVVEEVEELLVEEVEGLLEEVAEGLLEEVEVKGLDWEEERFQLVVKMVIIRKEKEIKSPFNISDSMEEEQVFKEKILKR